MFHVVQDLSGGHYVVHYRLFLEFLAECSLYLGGLEFFLCVFLFEFGS